MIDPGHPRLSIVHQCELASISRSSFYREPTAENEETLRLMRLIDELFDAVVRLSADGAPFAPQRLVRWAPSGPSADCSRWVWRRSTSARRPANRIGSIGYGPICFAIMTPTVAVLDCLMRGLTGLDVLARISAERRATKVVLLTASYRELIAAFAPGAKGVLLKEATPPEFVHCIRHVARAVTGCYRI
jgi:CheY-like chemotaxis protein